MPGSRIPLSYCLVWTLAFFCLGAVSGCESGIIEPPDGGEDGEPAVHGDEGRVEDDGGDTVPTDEDTRDGGGYLDGEEDGQDSGPADLDTDPDDDDVGGWNLIAGADGLGRVLPGPDDTGGLRSGKFVGIFYFLWTCESGTTDTRGPTDVTKILARTPAAGPDPLHPAWNDSHSGYDGNPYGSNAHYHHWGEPLFGYYCSRDPWVVRRHIQLLSDAGVDFLVFDATNAFTYDSVAETVMIAIEDVQRQGQKAPLVVFYTNSSSGRTMTRIYDKFYAPGATRRHPDTWFHWKSKPLIIGRGSEASSAVRNFFTIRESQWPTESQRDCGWPWMDFDRPQPVYSCNGRPEIINVSIAQHSETIKMSSYPFYKNDKNWGRGYHDGIRDHSAGAIARGANFAEQWERALQQDPPVVFVTGWNEWIAGRFYSGSKHFMVDAADQEFSRDAEMMRGGYGDNYYLQMAGYIRRFKGQPPWPAVGAHVTIPVDGGFDPWTGVALTFYDYTGDTAHRNHKGVGSNLQLVNQTGRNDFSVMKVARDTNHIYFYVRTAAAISPRTDAGWMRLLIDSDGDPTNGFEGFDYVVNRQSPISESEAVLEKSTGGWNWTVEASSIAYRVEGNQLHLAVPKSALQLGPDPAPIRFKWADNNLDDGDILSTYELGDSAPEGRLGYALITD